MWFIKKKEKRKKRQIISLKEKQGFNSKVQKRGDYSLYQYNLTAQGNSQSFLRVASHHTAIDVFLISESHSSNLLKSGYRKRIQKSLPMLLYPIQNSAISQWLSEEQQENTTPLFWSTAAVQLQLILISIHFNHGTRTSFKKSKSSSRENKSLWLQKKVNFNIEIYPLFYFMPPKSEIKLKFISLMPQTLKQSWTPWVTPFNNSIPTSSSHFAAEPQNVPKTFKPALIK